MSELTLRDRELVALGAALAANCIPCVEFHIPKAREAGISDAELSEVLTLADKVRQVPAKKVLEVADRLVKGENAEARSTPEQCAETMGAMDRNPSCC
jgi:4-carboxymuconolactone decarboxylase